MLQNFLQVNHSIVLGTKGKSKPGHSVYMCICTHHIHKNSRLYGSFVRGGGGGGEITDNFRRVRERGWCVGGWDNYMYWTELSFKDNKTVSWSCKYQSIRYQNSTCKLSTSNDNIPLLFTKKEKLSEHKLSE